MVVCNDDKKIPQDVTNVHMKNFLFSLNTVLTLSGAMTLTKCTITSPELHLIQKGGPFKPSLHDNSAKMYQSRIEQYKMKLAGSTLVYAHLYGMCSISLILTARFACNCHFMLFSIQCFIVTCNEIFISGRSI